MLKQALVSEIIKKESFLCVGLDSDPLKIPACLSREKNPILKFNQEIIEATKDLVVSYKPNLAFYESMGAKGWKILEETLQYIPSEIFTIADAKRGDIGNTSRMYAKTFFEYYDFDAVTVAPYMGVDSVSPFLEFDDKWVILLGLTSNKGSNDFQHLKVGELSLYEYVMKKSMTWGTPENLMFVIGATHPEKFAEIRQLIPHHFYLVPGVGAQGGTVAGVAEHGANSDLGLLVNSSRGIIYASAGKDFAEKARESALSLQLQMKHYVDQISNQ